MLNRLFDNPILVKHARSRLRRQHIVPLVVVTLLICACILWAGFAIGEFDNGVIFSVFFAIQGIALLVAGTNQVVASIGQVKESGILDFHRVSPLPAPDIAVGFLLGAPIREYLVAACVFPFALIGAWNGPPGVVSYLILLVVLLCSTLLFHALGLVGGLATGRHKRTGNGVTVLVILAHFSSPLVFAGISLPGLLTVLPVYTEVMGHNQLGAGGPMPQFFGVDLPLFMQSVIYQLSLFVFLLIAVTRRMRIENAHLYSKTTASAFLTTVAVLAMGGLVEHPQLQPNVAVTVLVYAISSVAMILILSITPTAGEFANGIRRSEKHKKHRPAPWTDLAANYVTVVVFCGIVLSTVQVAYRLTETGAQDARSWIVTGTALGVVAYFGFATQFFELAFGRRARPYFLLFLFLVWLLPIMVGMLIGISSPEVSEHVLELSPIFGVASGKVLALVSSLVLAAVCGLLALRASRRLEATIRTASSLLPATNPIEK